MCRATSIVTSNKYQRLKGLRIPPRQWKKKLVFGTAAGVRLVYVYNLSLKSATTNLADIFLTGLLKIRRIQSLKR